MNFIKTSDPETAVKLRDEGLICISEDSGFWTFIINGKNMNFSGCKNIVFTDILTV